LIVAVVAPFFIFICPIHVFNIHLTHTCVQSIQKDHASCHASEHTMPAKDRSPAVELKIYDYEDIAGMEKEISRLLHCEDGRTPAHANTVSYFRFRSNVIQMLSKILDKENEHGHSSHSANAFKIYLPQGLFVECCADEASSCILASIAWVPGSCIYKENEVESNTEDQVERNNRACKKRTRRCSSSDSIPEPQFTSAKNFR